MDSTDVGLWICESDVDFKVPDAAKEIGRVEIPSDVVRDVLIGRENTEANKT